MSARTNPVEDEVLRVQTRERWPVYEDQRPAWQGEQGTR